MELHSDGLGLIRWDIYTVQSLWKVRQVSDYFVRNKFYDVGYLFVGLAIYERGRLG